MKAITGYFIGIFISLLIPGLCSAQGLTFDEVSRQPYSFLGGFLTGYAAHEMGHIIVAGSLGYPIEYTGGSITYGTKPMGSHDQRRIASAGFQAQWIASEFAFSARAKSNSTYAAGVICAHLAISAAYLTFLKNQNLGDSVGFANATGLSTDQVVWSAAIPALLDSWRLIGDKVPRWVPAMSIAGKGIGITAIWVY